MERQRGSQRSWRRGNTEQIIVLKINLQQIHMIIFILNLSDSKIHSFVQHSLSFDKCIYPCNYKNIQKIPIIKKKIPCANTLTPDISWVLCLSTPLFPESTEIKSNSKQMFVSASLLSYPPQDSPGMLPAQGWQSLQQAGPSHVSHQLRKCPSDQSVVAPSQPQFSLLQ